MSIDPMFWLATAAFAWGLSLASYRWFATYNGWPMGEWQAHRPGLPIAIGLLAVMFAVFFAVARGGETVLVLPLFGLICALALDGAHSGCRAKCPHSGAAGGAGIVGAVAEYGCTPAEPGQLWSECGVARPGSRHCRGKATGPLLRQLIARVASMTATVVSRSASRSAENRPDLKSRQEGRHGRTPPSS